MKVENKMLSDKLESKTNKDVVVVTESQTSNMEVDNTQDENIQQIQVLNQMSRRGFKRNSPQRSPSE